MNMRKTLGLCMIVKNEEKNIVRCINSVKDIVDEIIVVDTGSTDATIKAAQELGAKVFTLPWDNDFSKARNFSLEKSSCDWILLLDADEELERGDRDAVLNFIHSTDLDGAHFTLCNYMGGAVSENYTVHKGFRLLRNNGQYHFVGEIHEQIARKDGEKIGNRFGMEDIKIYHYGYMDDEVERKQKRERNLPILLKQLRRHPEDAFTLFNIGNEYLSQFDYATALSYYLKAKEHMDVTQAYCPHMYYRMVTCYQNLLLYEKAIAAAQEGLAIYPGCTDLEFLKGAVELDSRRVTLAAESLLKCLEMGDPPVALKFIEGCGTFRAAMMLGEMYFNMEDYEKAAQYYVRAIGFNPKLQGLLYKVGQCLHRQGKDGKTVQKEIYDFFADPDYEPNAVVAIDILLEEGLYDPAKEDLEKKKKTGAYDAEFQFLQAKACFLTHDYQGAVKGFTRLFAADEKGPFLFSDFYDRAAICFYLSALIFAPETAGETLEKIKRHAGRDLCAAMDILLAVYEGKDLEKLDENLSQEVWECFMRNYDGLLKVSEFDLFEKLLPALNLVDSRAVLLRLADLYEKNGFRDMAARTVLRSVKELDVIDAAGARILYKEIKQQVSSASK